MVVGFTFCKKIDDCCVFSDFMIIFVADYNYINSLNIKPKNEKITFCGRFVDGCLLATTGE